MAYSNRKETYSRKSDKASKASKSSLTLNEKESSTGIMSKRKLDESAAEELDPKKLLKCIAILFDHHCCHFTIISKIFKTNICVIWQQNISN